jgi:3-oxoacyl-[acyl-carrier-protein] synthase III
MIHSRIIGTGSYLPEKVLTNSDLERMVDTSDEWIRTRSGIRSRHVAAEGQLASDLALPAAQAALKAANVESREIDLIIVATTTPDMIFPGTATILQAKLGIAGCPAFDVQAVCSGFVYALTIADMFIRTGQARRALVVGTEVYSRILDWTDRGTCVLFGDGAGAVLLAASDRPGILASKLHADGTHKDMLCVPGSVHAGKVWGTPFVKMDGGSVFKFAVKVFEEAAREVLEAAGKTVADIDWFIPHQANIRIMEATARKLGLPVAKLVATVHHHGNTSAASIPLALDEAVKDGRIQPGQTLLLEGVGGGFTWGAVLLRW